MVNRHICTVVPFLDDGISCNHFRRSEILAGDRQEMSYYADMTDLAKHQLFHALVSNESNFFMELDTIDELYNVVDEYKASKDYYNGVIGKAVFADVTVACGKLDRSISNLRKLVSENKRRIHINTMSRMTQAERLTCSLVKFRGGSNTTSWIGSLETTPYQNYMLLVNNASSGKEVITIDNEVRRKVACELRRASEYNFTSVKELDRFIQYNFISESMINVKNLFMLTVLGNILTTNNKVDVQDIISTAIYNAGLEFTGGRYVNKG